MADTIRIENLADELAAAIAGYSDGMTEKVMKAIDEESKEALKRLKTESPKLTGDYGKGWTSKKSYSGKYSKVNTIHNKTDYQLTHLLEFGHAKRNGGRVAPRPHIKPVEMQVVENLTRKVEDAAHGNG
ncbi:MAG: HK97 gp10 family phage protein [Dorea sp.]|nr:HK97 gp10 family phage protein [Dorea sp.]